MSGVDAKPPCGFTLIELLITTSIIGILSAVGMASYSFARMKARDAKRVSDIRTLRNAVETYFEQNGKYPAAPREGLVIGSDAAKVISDAGITPLGGQSGIVYLLNAPSNVLPGGVPYLYRSKNLDGSICTEQCFRYEIAFSLESTTGDYLPGQHLLTDEGIEGPETGASGVSRFGLAAYVPTADDLAKAFGSVAENAKLAAEVAARPEVQAANRLAVAPVSVVAAGANLVAVLGTVLPLANAGQLVLLFAAQPLLALGRRRRETWGTVYDAYRKVPIDLATVRLIDARTGRPVGNKVTDKDGRYAFTPRAGTYRLEVVKPGYLFPSSSLATVQDDGKFADIYHGTLIESPADGAQIAPNVPLDPEREPPEEAREILSAENKKKLRKAAAMTGPVLGAVALAVTPSLPMLALFLVHLFLYQLFRRLAEPPRPKSQGVVFDIDTREPVSGAVVRVLSLPYHKVLETRLTDAAGRYSFYVGNGKYYLTVTKPGWKKTETDEVDFTAIDKPTFIASDLPLQKAVEPPVDPGRIDG